MTVVEVYESQDAGRGVRVPVESEIGMAEDVEVMRYLPYAATFSYAWQKDRQVCWYCFQCTRRRWTIRCCTASAKQTCGSVYCSEVCRDADADWVHGDACEWLSTLRSHCLRSWKLSDFDAMSDKLEPWLAACPKWDQVVPNPILDAYIPTTDEYELMQLVLGALCRRRREMLMWPDLLPSLSAADGALIPSWKDVERMQDNQEAFEQHQSSGRLKLMYAFLSTVVKLPMTLLGSDSILFRTVVFREVANSFGIWDTPDGVHDASELLGYAIYPQATFFNHSCDPNVSKSMNGRHVVMRSIRCVDVGQPLTIAYGHVQDSVMNRRARLEANYFFHCKCERCESEALHGHGR